MSLKIYQRSNCKIKQLAFASEHQKRLSSCHCTDNCFWVELPNNPSVVHATETLGGPPLLDSYESAYDLDRLLTIEASRERELKELHHGRLKQ